MLEISDLKPDMVLKGTVRNVVDFGCFVDIPEIAASGLVHVSLLSPRFVKFNGSDQTLSAPGGGRWRVGDRLRVHVARVDFRQRRIDFVPADNGRKGRR